MDGFDKVVRDNLWVNIDHMVVSKWLKFRDNWNHLQGALKAWHGDYKNKKNKEKKDLVSNLKDIDFVLKSTTCYKSKESDQKA